MTSFANTFATVAKRAIDAGKSESEALAAAYERIAGQYGDYSFSTDRKVAKAMMKHYRDIAAPEHYLKDIPADFATMDIDAFVDEVYDNSAFCSAEALKAAIEEKGAAILEDPAVTVGKSIYTECLNLQTISNTAMPKEYDQSKTTYTAGLLEWKDGEPSYPDANSTMRLTYGTVKGYSPKDAVVYKHYTTLDGVMEKEDPDNWVIS